MGTNVKNKRQRVIITDLEKQGCVTRETKNGVMIKFPNGDSMVMTGSESDHRAEKNTRARVKRAGLTWYFDQK